VRAKDGTDTILVGYKNNELSAACSLLSEAIAEAGERAIPLRRGAVHLLVFQIEGSGLREGD